MAEDRGGRRHRRQRAMHQEWEMELTDSESDASVGDVLEFDPDDRAPAELREALLARIFHPIAAAATEGVSVPEHLIGEPPVVEREGARVDYPFQELIPGPPVRKSWNWIKSHSTFFYQDPQRGTRYYLRIKNNNCGVPREMWAACFPNSRPNSVREPQFRTFELIDTNEAQQLDMMERQIVYFEADLASAAPRHDLMIEVDEHQNFDRIGMQLFASVQDWREIHDLIADARFVPRSQIVNVAMVAFAILQHIVVLPERIEGDIRVIFTYEVYSSEGNETILLSAGETIAINANAQIDDQDFAARILMVLWAIRRKVMEAQYNENGVHAFHLRTVRFVVAPMPIPGGRVYMKPPIGFGMPRGGCMSVAGLPLSLISVLKDVIITHDVYKQGVFFDNNCGIRETMVNMDFHILKMSHLKKLYHSAALIRGAAVDIPPFVKLDPSQVYQVMRQFVGCDFPFAVYALPAPEHPRVHCYRSPNYDPEDPKSIRIVYSHKHYFSLRGENAEERFENLKRLRNLLYCHRCKRYVIMGDGTKSHQGEVPNVMRPLCERRVKVFTKKGVAQPSIMGKDPQEYRPRTLKEVKHEFMTLWTQLENVGFMDLETFRPDEDKVYHEVYAVGWIQQCKEEIQTDEVVIYSILDDPGPRHSPLVHALSDLVALIESKPEQYSEKKPYVLWLYNGSRFDNAFIVDVFTNELKMHPTNSAFKDGQWMSLTYLNGSLIVIDLCLFILCSLKFACKMFNVSDLLAKGHLEHDLINSIDDITEKWYEIDEYLRKDLTALNMVFVGFRKVCADVFGLDPCKRITMSHLSYEYWISTLTQAQREHVILPADFDQYLTILKAYYGGRVFPQVKYWKSEDFDKTYAEIIDSLVDVDVVSLYPSAMWFSKAISEAYFESIEHDEEPRDVPLYFCGDPEIVVDGDEFWQINRLLTHVVIPEQRYQPSMDFWRKISMIGQQDPEGYGEILFDLRTKGAIVCVSFKPPTNLFVPILPHKDVDGNTAWDLQPHTQQWYVLEEILDAIYYGYEVTDLHAALIYPHREDLFAKAMDTLMTGKASCKRGDPRRDVYKLGANAIYGKHAQKAIFEETKLISADSLDKLAQDEYLLSVEPLISRVADIDAFKAMRRPAWINNDSNQLSELEERMEYFEETNQTKERIAPINSFVVKVKPNEIALPKPTYLGAQVTAYARIRMNWFLFRLGVLYSSDIRRQLFYTDTDSAIVHAEATQDPGNERLFGNQLGQLDDELEGGRIIELACLAPKTYGMVYVMPDNSRWFKIRAKGLPHTKEKLEAKRTLMYGPWFWKWDEETECMVIAGERLSLDERVYMLVSPTESVSLAHLDVDAYRAILFGGCALSTYFSSMRRCHFGAHGFGDVSGIRHSHLSRTLSGASWWDGPSEQPNPPHRREHRYSPGVTVPIGFSADLPPATPPIVLQEPEIPTEFGQLIENDEDVPAQMLPDTQFNWIDDMEGNSYEW